MRIWMKVSVVLDPAYKLRDVLLYAVEHALDVEVHHLAE